MFMFLVVSFVVSVTTLFRLVVNDFNLNTFILFIVSSLFTYFFYKAIEDENSDWGCD